MRWRRRKKPAPVPPRPEVCAHLGFHNWHQRGFMWNGLHTRYCHVCRGIQSESDQFIYFVPTWSDAYPSDLIERLFGNGNR